MVVQWCGERGAQPLLRWQRPRARGRLVEAAGEREVAACTGVRFHVATVDADGWRAEEALLQHVAFGELDEAHLDAALHLRGEPSGQRERVGSVRAAREGDDLDQHASDAIGTRTKTCGPSAVRIGVHPDAASGNAP
jgi:hypothetical protein